MRGHSAASILSILAILAFSPEAEPQAAKPKVEESVHTESAGKAQTPNLAGVWDTQHPGGFKPGTTTFFGTVPPLTAWGEQQFLATRPSSGPRAVPDSTDPVYPTKLGAPG